MITINCKFKNWKDILEMKIKCNCGNIICLLDPDSYKLLNSHPVLLNWETLLSSENIIEYYIIKCKQCGDNIKLEMK